MTLLDATLDAIDTIREVVDGIRALPACAEAVRELAEFEREAHQASRDVLDDMELRKVTAERDLLQRKLDYLLRPRKQSEEPCEFDNAELVLALSKTDWWLCSAAALRQSIASIFWRPVDLTHFEE